MNASRLTIAGPMRFVPMQWEVIPVRVPKGLMAMG